MQKSFQSIKYAYFPSAGKKDLAVVLPGAGLTPHSHDAFISHMRRLFNVLFVTDGYFGLQRLDGETTCNRFSRTSFRRELHALISTFPHRKLYLLGSSVGTIHALNYARWYPKETNLLVLASPPIGTRKANLLMTSITNLFLISSAETSLSIFLKMIEKIPQLKGIAKHMCKMQKYIGAHSYLLCLKEISCFSNGVKKEIEHILSEKSIIIGGKEDPIFQHFCNKELFLKARALYEIHGRHALFVEAPKEVMSIIRKELPS